MRPSEWKALEPSRDELAASIAERYPLDVLRGRLSVQQANAAKWLRRVVVSALLSLVGTIGTIVILASSGPSTLVVLSSMAMVGGMISAIVSMLRYATAARARTLMDLSIRARIDMDYGAVDDSLGA